MMKWILPLLTVTGAILSQALAGDMPAPLDRALAEAEETPTLRLSYTMRFEWPGEPPVTARYDAVTEKWNILSGNPDDLPSAAREKFRNVQKSESVPGGLLYADFRRHLKQVTPIETGDDAVYRFIPPEAEGQDITDETEASVRARLYMKDGILQRYEVRGLKPFKPMPIMKMEEFVVEQDFQRLGQDGPAVLHRLYSRQKGSRLFRQVDTEFTATFSAFAPLN